MNPDTPQCVSLNPLTVPETDHYQKEYVRSFVDKWDELIDWEKREQNEGNFFVELLSKKGVRKILDVATGTGFHSICLLKANFEVLSADGCAEMLTKANQNGKQRGHRLNTIQTDWRWLSYNIHEPFDAIICLGNSFTHLFSDKDRRKALSEFYTTLSPNGILILDQRNYDAIMDIGYRSKHRYYYCGDNIGIKPEHIDDGIARFRYSFPDQSVFHLNMYPLRKAYTRQLIYEAGFRKIKTYGDFQESYCEENTDFFIHVAQKCQENNEERL